MKSVKRYNLALLFALCIYIVTWSTISILRVEAFDATVYDLGISVQRSWLVVHYSLGLKTYLYIFLTSGIIYLFIPFTLIGGLQFFLILQSVALGLPSVFIYKIAKLKNQRPSLIYSLPLLYLIYFPLAGVNFFDFHYQAFFMVFYILGYYLFLKGRFLYSGISFFLAGSTHYLFFIYVLLFALVEISSISLTKYRSIIKKEEYFSKSELIFLALLLIVSITMITSVELIGKMTELNTTLHIYSNVLTMTSLQKTVFVFILILIPFLFIPILTKWSLCLLPPFILIFISNNPGYFYPLIFQDQYTSSIIPFVLLGLLDFSNSILYRKVKITFPKVSKLHLSKLYSIVIVFMIVSMGLFFLPYSPLNSTTIDNFHLNQSVKTNESQENSFLKVASLIPDNNPYILVQNNLPQLYPRVGPLNGSIIVPGLVGPNITNSDISSNRFPYLPGGYTQIDYVIADINNLPNFVSPVANLYGIENPSSEGIPSMEQILIKMISSHFYGVLAESNGFIILERNYTLEPILFTQSSIYFPASSFEHPQFQSVKAHGDQLEFNFFNGSDAWWGPYSYILPGRYVVTFNLKVGEHSSIKSLRLDVISANRTFASRNITEYNRGNSTVNLSFNESFNVDNIFGNMEFRGISMNITGTVSLTSVYLKLIKPI